MGEEEGKPNKGPEGEQEGTPRGTGPGITALQARHLRRGQWEGDRALLGGVERESAVGDGLPQEFS